MRIYDPPSGWQFGFPKEYKPLKGETFEETLFRDGYPQRLINQGMAKYCRFWSHEVAEEPSALEHKENGEF